MDNNENQIKRKWIIIDMQLLTLKLHYFMSIGGLGATHPYLALKAQQLGLSATATGLIYTALPFTYIFSNPIIGAITDRFHKMKHITMILVMITAILHGVIPFIPPMKMKTFEVNVDVECKNTSSSTILESSFDSNCLKLFRNDIFKCDYWIKNCNIMQNKNKRSGCQKICRNNNTEIKTGYFVNNLKQPSNQIAVQALSPSSFLCECPEVKFHVLSCSSSTQICINMTEVTRESVYQTLQFWSFAVVMFLSGIASASAFSITDTACYNTLGDRTELYGQQRLWGTIGYGSVSLLTGYINDKFSSKSNIVNYTPGFIITFIMLLVDVIIIYKLDIKQINSSKAVFKDLSRAFLLPRNILFAVGTFVTGTLASLLLNNEMWFLNDLGASQLLLGLSIFVRCLLAEVPFFFISGTIIKTFGHFFCVIFAFVAFILRFLYYYFLVNPWFVLPVESLHGITFGIFYAAMTSYSNKIAPLGAEAAMFGVFYGLYEGLGLAVGSLLGGVGYDLIGARMTFLIAAVIGAISAILFFLGNFSLTILYTSLEKASK